MGHVSRHFEVAPMPQANVDPAELRRFANNLRNFNNDLQASMQAVHAQLVGLSQTWRDREHDKFAQGFEETMTVVSRFLEATEQHIPFLLRKADRAEEYLRQR
jgi:uncharacterized protein YukE